MEQVIGFLIILSLVVFFLPITSQQKIKRLREYKINNRSIKVKRVIRNGLYRSEYVVEYKRKTYQIKCFFCFGYIDIENEEKISPFYD